MANRLQNETSPYLLQHANNPVDWYAWSKEALTRARTENKPILLSVGYSACHWCHVMEHECFENESIAKQMNENFVCIKVDREERPDLDQIYQNVAQLITRGGGWPLTVFLTPELKPFFGGTYFPPEDKYGRPGFPKVLEMLSRAFREDQEGVQENARRLIAAMTQMESARPSEETDNVNEVPTADSLRETAKKLLLHFDWKNGGFGSAPKFPQVPGLKFLWRYGQVSEMGQATDAVLLALERMAKGGIFDHLGGGFARYSVDEFWLVPHFEKMLYDNGLLLELYSEAICSGKLSFAQTELFQNIVRTTAEYLLREMQTPEKLFYSAQDADSEGEEGKFFVWTQAELLSALTQAGLSQAEAAAACRYFGATEGGNFEHSGTNVLSIDDADAAKDFPLERARKTLFELREKRVKPARDDKSLVSWNALAIRGLAMASLALGEKKFADAAKLAFAAVVSKCGSEDDRLKSVWAQGRAKFNAYLDDYAGLASAALVLTRVEDSSEQRSELVSQAEKWISRIWRDFKDSEEPGFFFTSQDHEKFEGPLLMRPKSVNDQATPSGMAVALEASLVLADIKGDEALEERACRELFALYPAATSSPWGMGELAHLATLYLAGVVTVSGDVPNQVLGNGAVYRALGESEHAQICHRKTCFEVKTSEIAAELEKKLKF